MLGSVTNIATGKIFADVKNASGSSLYKITRVRDGKEIVPDDRFRLMAVEDDCVVQATVNGDYDTPPSLEYSLNGVSYSTLIRGSISTPVTLNKGDVMYIRGNNSKGLNVSTKDYVNFTSSKKIKAFGNIQYLIDKTGNTMSLPSTYSYYKLFSGMENLLSAPELPVTTLKKYCYSRMFEGCTSLIKPPKLPATALADSCYEGMFWDCASLVEAPELPATTLFDSCYIRMLRGCTSLTNTPKLPATTLAPNCYREMFDECTSLTKVPELPVTTLANACYTYMFAGCTSLVKAPELPATTLFNMCYCGMFSKCSGIKLSTTKTGEYRTQYMIPSGGSGIPATEALKDMFTDTGGTFTGEPGINTLYYGAW